MSYASPEQLAAALRVRVTPENTDRLTSCLAAAADEIDAFLDRSEPLADPVPESVVLCNVNRAVEWWKAPDAAGGQVGFAQTGVLSVPPDGFDRHAGTILQHKQKWGVA